MTTKVPNAQATHTAKPAKKLNTAQRNQLITHAILEAIKAGKGNWITGIVPAVTALNVTKSNYGLKVRSCLNTLIVKGLVYRVSFTSEELYDWAENKVSPVEPEGGFTTRNRRSVAFTKSGSPWRCCTCLAGRSLRLEKPLAGCSPRTPWGLCR